MTRDYYDELQYKASEINLRLLGLAHLHSHYIAEDEEVAEMEARMGIGRLLVDLAKEVKALDRALDFANRPEANA